MIRRQRTRPLPVDNLTRSDRTILAEGRLAEETP